MSAPPHLRRSALTSNAEGNPRVYILPYHLYACGRLPAVSLINTFRGPQNVHFGLLSVRILPHYLLACGHLPALLLSKDSRRLAECTLGPDDSLGRPRWAGARPH